MSESKSPRWLSWLVLLLLMVVALVLRWRYIQEISLSVDEFNTIWAARNVLVRGLPSFPSGNIYPHGFVFTYLQVPFVLGELNETLVRIPGLLVSLAGISAAYWVGRKLFSDRVGLITAAALAVDPDCILWGGRARMYGLLQLFTILIIYFFYRGLVDDRPRDRYVAMGLLVVAIFTHLEAALLLPALGLAMLVAWPWRRIFRWSVIGPFIIAVVGATIFLLMSKYGQPGHLETLQESRPYLELTAGIMSAPRVFAPVFVDLHRLPFTLLSFVGLYFLFRPQFDRRSPLTYLYIILFAIVIPLFLLAGPTWQNTRYLFMLLPLLYFTGGEVICRLLDLVPALKRTRPWQPAALALLVTLYVGLTGTSTAYAQELGYDQAFRYLRDQMQPNPGDQIITLSPSACVLYMEECDRFAIQHGYEEFVVERPGDGVIADLWAATPVLTETAELVELLNSAPGVWFVSDSWRFQTRYDADFIQTVLDHMDLVYNERGVMIWHGEGYALASEPTFQRERRADFDNALALVGFGLSPLPLSPGDELQVVLHWQALEQAGVGYTASLQLLRSDGRAVAGTDALVLGGLYQPDFWPVDMTFSDPHQIPLPSELPPGRYRLDLGLYPAGQPGQLLPVADSDRVPLAMLSVGEVPAQTSPATAVNADFGAQIRLTGYDLDCDPQHLSCDLGLHWQGLAPMDQLYTVFVHLLSSDGSIVAQADGPPGDPFFTTFTWLPGAQVLDKRLLVADSGTPAGEYTLVVGLYHQPTAERILITDSIGKPLGDTLPLTTLTLDDNTP